MPDKAVILQSLSLISINQSINQSVSQSVSQSINQSINQSIILFQATWPINKIVKTHTHKDKERQAVEQSIHKKIKNRVNQ